MVNRMRRHLKHLDLIRIDIKADTPNTCVARKRDWSVVPDNSGDGTDALIYKGSLKANGEKIKGTATTTDNWQKR